MNLEKFLVYLQLNYNSPKTIENYYKSVMRYKKFSNGVLNKEWVENYILDLKERGKTQSAINLFLNSIRKYMKYANIEFELPREREHKRNKHHPYFTEKDLDDILNSMIVLYPYDYKKRKQLLIFMFYTGMRISEVLKVKKENVDFKKQRIVVCGKGSKTRVIPFINKKLVRVLKEICKNDGYLFDYGQSCVRDIFQKIKKHFKYDGAIQSRTMRRSFAKYCLSKGMDISYLKEMMGHNDILTTEIYAEPTQQMIDDKCNEIMNEKEDEKE